MQSHYSVGAFLLIYVFPQFLYPCSMSFFRSETPEELLDVSISNANEYLEDDFVVVSSALGKLGESEELSETEKKIVKATRLTTQSNPRISEALSISAIIATCLVAVVAPYTLTFLFSLPSNLLGLLIFIASLIAIILCIVTPIRALRQDDDFVYREEVAVVLRHRASSSQRSATYPELVARPRSSSSLRSTLKSFLFPRH